MPGASRAYTDVSLPLFLAMVTDYDPSLTSRIQAELDRVGALTEEEQGQLTRLIERLEDEFRSLVSDPSRRDRTLAFLRSPSGFGARVGRAHPDGGPLRRALHEMVDLSTRLDRTSDPTEGFAVAESVADRAHLVAHTVEGFLGALDPADAISSGFHRLAAFISQLIRNAVNKMREFAEMLHVSSFAVTFATVPPQVSVTFTFGGG
jgi:hypothetical protein